MTLPSIMYGDPSNAVDWQRHQEIYEIRENKGCEACKYHKTSLGVGYCDKGRTPGPRFFCKSWELK